MSGIKKLHIVGDFHCHTIASVHAYSTLRENLTAAKAKGLQALAITDHGIGCPDSPTLSYFDNLTSLPEQVDGLRLLRGVEANIMDHDGSLDMPEGIMERLDIVVASYHTSCVRPGTEEEHTRSYLRLAENPYVDIIGHSGSAEFAFDYNRVVPVLGEAGKIFEINAHTFLCRKKSVENCKKIALLCKKHRFPVLVNSDAHSEFELASCSLALEMLDEIDFPEELIINTSLERMEDYLLKYKSGK